jgi:hypothetical protein
MYHPPDSRRAVLGAVPIQLSASRTPVEQFMEAKFARFLSKLAQANYSPTVRDFFTGNTSLPRDVFFAAGGFDPDFNAYGNEDGELAVRLLEMGVEIVYGSEAMAHQHYEKTFAVLARDSIEKGRTAVLFAAKHPEMRQLLRLDAAAGCSRKWRLCRGTLLRLSDRIPSAPELVIRFVEMIERRRPANLERYYLLALDYFFRLGAEQALRTEGTAEHARRSAVMQS